MATQPRPAKPRQAQGMSLHIGINEVQASAYAGWTGPLAACEFDASDLAALAKGQGMTPRLLLTRQATRSKVLASLRAAARRLEAGDLFLLSYSGHGGQVPDVSGEEPDKLDETWCLYDGQLIDDELYFLLSGFRSGVRVVVLSDSCHSGTVVRAGRPPGAGASARPRIMPPAVGMRVYQAHQAFYDRLQHQTARAAGGAVIDPDVALAQVALSPRLGAIVKDFQPAVLLISGCQDNQFSMDGDHNGAFTEQVLRIWNQGSFRGSYALFHAKVRAALPPSQSPNLFTLGPAAALLKQTPFTL